MALEEHILERAGAIIHYWLGGKNGAPLVIFTHGATIDHHEWDADVLPLLADFRVLVWDVRAHGLSRPAEFHFQETVDDLAALSEQHSDTPVVLVGHSMGGNLSQELAFQHPELVRAMLCLDCTWNFQRLSALEKAGLAAAGPIFRLYPYETLIRQSLDVTVTNPQGREVLERAMRLLSKQETIAVMLDLANCLHEEPDYTFGKPLWLLMGEEESTGNISKAMPLWADHEPLSRFIVVPGAKHAANLDNPEFFQEKLLEFLRSL
jgi:pimeloyl-ACP methyl ester carboxylesterase